MFHILLAAGAALLDQRLKDGIEAQPADTFPLSAAGGKIILKRVHNPGSFLNIGAKHPGAVRAGNAGVFSFFLLYFLALLRKPGRHLTKTGLALIVGGSASNLCDRFRRGYVVDYFSFPFRRIKHIVFNLGDLFLFAGSLVYAAGTLFSQR
ncbi:MAG: signal peptidase II [Lachnospiraceae bacterium]|nr:signal peptidase II [Lachnospiraceae bacterium]